MGNKLFLFCPSLVTVHLLLLEESLFHLLGISWRLAEALASFFHSSGSSHFCLMSICGAHKTNTNLKATLYLPLQLGILPATKMKKHI